MDAATPGLGANERRNLPLTEYLREVGSQREYLAQVIEGILLVVKLDVSAPAIVNTGLQCPRSR